MDSKDKAIKEIENKLKQLNPPGLEKALKDKLKVLKGNNTVLK